MKDRKLKIAIVFLHEVFRFEAWLSGVNRQVQSQYWELIKESGWNKYKIVPPAKGVDSILESILVSNPDFTDLDALTRRIETTTLEFIRDIESFLSNYPGQPVTEQDRLLNRPIILMNFASLGFFAVPFVSGPERGHQGEEYHDNKSHRPGNGRRKAECRRKVPHDQGQSTDH